MKLIVADFNNVISTHAWLFKSIAKENKLIVVSGMPKTKWQEVADFLRENKIEVSDLIMCPFEWSRENYLESKTWKVNKIIELEADVFFDDDLNTLMEVKCLCIRSGKKEPELVHLPRDGYQIFEQFKK